MRKLEQIDQIYLTPYAHADHAWTNSRQWHIRRYIEGIARVLDYMRENPDYTFMIDNVLHSLQVFERYAPNRLPELRSRVEEGRIFIVNGGMALARPNLCGDELFLRNLIAGRTALQARFPAAELSLFFNADTGVGHSQMPQLLACSGHTHYRFYRPEAALDLAGIPREFLWKGLDGTAIVTTRGYYGSFLDAACCGEDQHTWAQRRAAFLREDVTDRLSHMDVKTLFLNVGSDDCYPQKNLFDKDADITGFVREWNMREQPAMRFSSPYEYHQALTVSPLPVWEGVCDPCDLFYNGPLRSHDSLYRMKLLGEQQLLILERLETLLLAQGGQIVSGKTQALWEQLYGISGHAMQWLLSADFEEVLELAQLMLNGAKQYRRALEQDLAQMAGGDYIITNLSPCDREETVVLHLTTPEHIRGLRLYDHHGRALHYQLLDTLDGDKAYVNKDFNEVYAACRLQIPAMGYCGVRAVCEGESIAPKAAAECFATAEQLSLDTPVVIENGLFRFTLLGGLLESVQTLKTNATVADGDLCRLRFYATDPTSDWTMKWNHDRCEHFCPTTVHYVQRGPLCHKLITQGTLHGLDASVTLTIFHNDPTIRVQAQFTSRADEGYYTMAFACAETPDILAGIPYGTETRDTSRIYYSEDAGISDDDYLFYERGCKGGYFANRYTALRLADCRVLLTQGDGTNLYRHKHDEIETIFMRTLDLRPRKSGWLHNAPSSLCGAGENRFSFTVSFLPPDTTLPQLEDIVSRERFPVLCTPRYNRDGRSPTAFSLLQNFPKALTLTACYTRENHLILRFYENSGHTVNAQIQLHQPIRHALVCDLLEQPTGELPVKDGAAQLTVAPWQIITVRIALS